MNFFFARFALNIPVCSLEATVYSLEATVCSQGLEKSSRSRYVCNNKKARLSSPDEFASRLVLKSGQVESFLSLSTYNIRKRDGERKERGALFLLYCGVCMFTVRLKALRAVAQAFALVGIVGGLAVSCENAGEIASQSVPQEQDFALAHAADAKASPMLMSQEEREAKKREFFAKPEVKEMSAGLEELAQAVAVAVEDKALRDRIYAKCMEKFDGETNVLWQQLEADADMKGRGGWSARIEREANKSRKNAVIKGIGNVSAAVKKFERIVQAPLHIFWMYPSTWDKKTTPLVAFVPFDKDPDERESIPVFDSEGNSYELDKKGSIARQRPVIVLTTNERTNADGTLRQGVFGVGAIGLDSKNSPTLQSNASFFRIKVEQIDIDASIRGHENEWEGEQEFFFSYTWWGSWGHTVGWLGKSSNATPSFSGLPSFEYDMVAPSVFFRYWEADGLWWDDWLYTHMINTNSHTADATVDLMTAELIEEGHKRYRVENISLSQAPDSYTYVKTRYRLVPKN